MGAPGPDIEAYGASIGGGTFNILVGNTSRGSLAAPWVDITHNSGVVVNLSGTF